ncbi:SPOR domain-containing protein [Pseudophaeobacter sp.]|uniref:SPOR domain-containing protein n=1 Tax=Pseudophaeobacter sp. TaxID=1971739 RepID=UPI003297D0A6
MAYFAQAGSGQAYTPSGIQDEGAGEQIAAQTKPEAKPQVNSQASLGLKASALKATPNRHGAGQSHSQSQSQFPAEGPDLHANYQSDYSGAAARQEATTVSPTAFSYAATPPSTFGAPGAAAPAMSNPEATAPAAPFEPAAVTAPQLQDYVSTDYAVPGLGAQSYGQRSLSDGASEQSVEQGYDQSYGAAAYAAPTYGGESPQGYSYDETPQDDYGYDDSGYQEPVARAGLARAASLLGAAASLALVIGIGAWGYQLVMRDVSGVPVVRAVEGPMRAQPEKPGGQQADHQGLAVNSVAANGTAEAPADRLTLAPQPIELSEDDQPMSRLTAPEADVAPQVEGQVLRVQPPQSAQSAQVSEASVAAYRNGDIDALVAELTDGVSPLAAGTGSDAAAAAPAIVQPAPLQPVEIAAIGAAPAPASTLRNAPGLKISLRPNLRPARFSPAVAQTNSGTGIATLEVDPKTLPAGTRLAQLGAYESAAVARAEWDRIYSRFDDYLEGKKRVIQRAESGGRTFYRLRAMGFDGLSDARRFCSALVAGKADCIPVTTR